jgi:hypothetical protein
MTRFVFAMMLSLVSIAGASDISLPLNGYYRLGRYMPVQFQGDSSELRWTADGAITTQIHGATGGIAPFLIVQSPVGNAPFAQPLHELGADEKLVGVVGEIKSPEHLFPDAKVIPIPLTTYPLPGPTAAWQSLDALVLTWQDMAGLSMETKAAFLAGGTTLAAAGPTAPDTQWAWHQEKEFWVLRAPAAISAAASDDAYQPLTGWTPGQSGTFRRDVVVLAAVFTILMIAAAKMKSIWTAAAAVILAGMSVIFLPVWERLQTPMATGVGTVQMDGPTVSFDTWVFQHALKDNDAMQPFAGLAFPILPAHGGPDGMTLICDGVGHPMEFHYRLAAERAAAFVYKAVSPSQSPQALSTPATSPLRLLLPSLYAGFTLQGEAPAPHDSTRIVTQWPTLVLANSEDIPK